MVGMTESKKNILIASDGTGETASVLLKSALVQYDPHLIKISRYNTLRSFEQIENMIEKAKEETSLIVYTFADKKLSEFLKKQTKTHKITSIDLLTPLFEVLDKFLKTSDGKNFKKPGLYHSVNKDYFKRIEAIEYTVKHDDGKLLSNFDQAHFILVGISRTSKTPLSIFLSHKGWKVANVPLILDIPLPQELLQTDQKKIIGLTVNLHNLYNIRKKRIEKFGQSSKKEYANLEYIEKEIDYAEKIFKKNRQWPVFDMTDKALEETAFEIIRIVSTRMNYEKINSF